jgi:hypothetical protein
MAAAEYLTAFEKLARLPAARKFLVAQKMIIDAINFGRPRWACSCRNA